MARAATTSDVFNAIAEPRRRQVLDFVALQEQSVNEIVDALGVGQPTVSKHLRVLKEVGLVTVRNDGRTRYYRANGEAVRPIFEWVKTYERFWRNQLERVKERAEEKARKHKGRRK